MSIQNFSSFLYLHRESLWGIVIGSLIELAHVAWLYYRKTHPPCRLSEVSVLEYVTAGRSKGRMT